MREQVIGSEPSVSQNLTRPTSRQRLLTSLGRARQLSVNKVTRMRHCLFITYRALPTMSEHHRSVQLQCHVEYSVHMALPFAWVYTVIDNIDIRNWDWKQLT